MVEVKAGKDLMEAAVAQNIPLVIGECGGGLSCATCHVVVDDAWSARPGWCPLPAMGRVAVHRHGSDR